MSLGGSNVYEGRTENRGRLGRGRPTAVDDIEPTTWLARRVSLVSALTARPERLGGRRHREPARAERMATDDEVGRRWSAVKLIVLGLAVVVVVGLCLAGGVEVGSHRARVGGGVVAGDMFVAHPSHPGRQLVDGLGLVA